MSVVQRAERGELTPDDGLTELRAIRAQRLTDIVAFPALVAPLITFLPGALLTIAVLELATGQILAGSSRFASGFFQLVLLALGIVWSQGLRRVSIPAILIVLYVAYAGQVLGGIFFGSARCRVLRCGGDSSGSRWCSHDRVSDRRRW